MAVYIRLDDAVRARLRGDAGSSASSGSEHEASACLSGLVQAFLETEGAAAGENGAGPASKGGEGYDSDDGDGPERAAAAAESVRELLDPPVEEDPFRVRLAAAVAAAMEAEPALRRYGRRSGAPWRGGCGPPGTTPACASRGGRLPVASRPGRTSTSTWSRRRRGGRRAGTLWTRTSGRGWRSRARRRSTPSSWRRAGVGGGGAGGGRRARRARRGRRARQSLRSHGLHVPPWRKTRYMLAKWLGPYKRSTATSPSAAGAMPMPAAAAGMDVKCRAVGFFTPPPAAPAARIK